METTFAKRIPRDYTTVTLQCKTIRILESAVSDRKTSVTVSNEYDGQYNRGRND